MREFYGPFDENLTNAYEHLKDFKLRGHLTDIKCEKCGKPMGIKFGRSGAFLACSGYPIARAQRTLSRTKRARSLSSRTRRPTTRARNAASRWSRSSAGSGHISPAPAIRIAATRSASKRRKCRRATRSRKATNRSARSAANR
ncbi:MAG: topoisomerase DNA-binding C4 zinc finger domain-containing protein [Deltaproteobacteria bacterium]|nr:topoisomerase DNA-binding C4 zinc finger domain-containing protein [Deltaproteobacteria bacterium]